MINAVGRDIPEEVLKATGKDIFRGAFAMEGHEYKKAAPTVRAYMDPNKSKRVDSIHDVLVKCGIKDGFIRRSPVKSPGGSPRCSCPTPTRTMLPPFPTSMNWGTGEMFTARRKPSGWPEDL